MLDLLNRLESMGSRGGYLGLAIGSAALLVVGLLVAYGLSLPETDYSYWSKGFFWFLAVLASSGLVYGVEGLRILTRQTYPLPEELFPPLTVRGLTEAIEQREADICVCVRCKIWIPSHFSTGACPVCSSSVEYYSIDDDEDAAGVIDLLKNLS